MKFVFPGIGQSLQIEPHYVSSLVIENPVFMRQVLTAFHFQLSGNDGPLVVSDESVPINISKVVEYLDVFIPFEINRKSLLSKVISRMESQTVESDYVFKGNMLLGEIESYLDELSLDLPCSIDYPKLTWNSLIKAVSPIILYDGDSLADQILQYMELISDLEGDKVFVLVGLRTVMDDPELSLFIKTATQHQYLVLLIDAISRPVLPLEHRLTIDYDLCEF